MVRLKGAWVEDLVNGGDFNTSEYQSRLKVGSVGTIKDLGINKCKKCVRQKDSPTMLVLSKDIEIHVVDNMDTQDLAKKFRACRVGKTSLRQ